MKKEYTTFFFKSLGFYQVFGALYGIYALFSSFSFLNMFTSLPFILLLLVSGIWLLVDLSHKSYKLAFYNQLIQTIQFEFLGFGLMYAAGFYVSIVSDVRSLERIYLDIRSWTFIFHIFLNTSRDEFYLAINFVPILILILMILFKDAIFQRLRSRSIEGPD